CSRSPTAPTPTWPRCGGSPRAPTRPHTTPSTRPGSPRASPLSSPTSDVLAGPGDAPLMGLREEAAEPWGLLLGATAGGLAWATGTPSLLAPGGGAGVVDTPG